MKMNSLVRVCTVTLLILNAVPFAKAQNQTPVESIVPASQEEPCAFDMVHKEMLMNDPVYRQRTIEFNESVKYFNLDAKVSTTTYRVPVVVHVMEAGNSLTEITDAQIRQAIKELNERYRKVPGSAGDGNGVDVELEFALAVRDPNGNCTNGIVRYDMTGDATYMSSGVYRTSAGISDAALKAYSVWDQTQYYNIWLVSEIDNNNGGAGIQGYAYFASSHGTSIDGAVILVSNFKNSGSTTGAHELGHAFNLYHTFEGDGGGSCPVNGNCATDGDLVCDTPPHVRSSSNCAIGTNSCDGGSSTELFIHNYMDYSSDGCQNEFTAGQKTRIIAAMSGLRASFLESNGNMSLVPPATAGVDFESDGSFVCQGSIIQFRDLSSCIPNTFLDTTSWTGVSFNWTFSDGSTTYTSTLQNPLITFSVPGVFDVTLEITNAFGTTSHTEQGMVVVGATPVAVCTPGSNNEGSYWNTVNNVSFNTINNATSQYDNVAYTDFSCSANTVVAAGTTYQMDIDLRAGGSGSEICEVYIDYNNNGSFLDAGELVLSGTTGGTNTTATVSGGVTIPGGAVTNTLLRMRVYGETNTLNNNERNCLSNLFIGDVEDYGVYISGDIASVSIAASPSNTVSYGTSVTFTASPVNGGTTPVYAWYVNGVLVPGETGATYVTATLVDGDEVYCTMTSNLSGVIASPATSNTVIMTVTGPPLSDFSSDMTQVCEGGIISFTDLSILGPTSWSWSFPGGSPSTSIAQNPSVTYNTAGVYQVELTASNVNGAGSTETKTGYITVFSSPVSICGPFSRTASPAGGIGITNVSLNTINNTTAFDDAVYQDFSCSQMTTLAPGTNYPISVTGSGFNDQWLRVYIDYNNNGSFSDAGELVFSPANGQGVRSGSFTTPASPALDQLLRMRVITDFVNTSPGACTSSLQYGQVEDYGVVISAPASPLPVNLLTFEAEGKGCSVVLNWKTASELNNDYYILERSDNGFDWEEIEVVDGIGTSQLIQEYSYRDAAIRNNGYVYYRLYQVDFDGSKELLGVTSATVFCEQNSEPVVYPNPVMDVLAVKAYGYMMSKIVLLDGSGRIVKEQIVGSDQVEMNISGFDSGMYYLHIESEAGTFMKRIVKN